MRKPRWILEGKTALTSVVVTNNNNFDDCEVFMIDLNTETSRLKYEGCVEASVRIRECLDRNTYFVGKQFVYIKHVKNEDLDITVTKSLNINIPTNEIAKAIEDKFELLAELLAMNGITFKRSYKMLVQEI